MPRPYLVTNADILRNQSLGFARMERMIMTLDQSVGNLLTLDTTVKGQVAQLLTDFAANTPGLSPEDQTAIAQVASDLQAESGNIAAADPNAAAPTPTTPTS